MFNLFKPKNIEEKVSRGVATGQVGYDVDYLQREVRELREKIGAIENYLEIRVNKRWRVDKIKKV